MHKILVTFLPGKGSGDTPYMDILEFPHLPSLGDFLTFGKDEAFEVVQVAHCLAQHETTVGVTVSPTPLRHAAILKSEQSRDNRPSA